MTDKTVKDFCLNDPREFERFFDLSLNMLCIAGTDAKFKKVNPKFTEVLGYSKEELLSVPFTQLIHPDDLEKTTMAIRKLDEGVKVIDFENRYFDKNGHVKHIKWAAAPEVNSGRIYAIGEDITEKKKDEYYKNEISKIRNLYISNISRSNAFWDKTLELILEITGSKYGFIGEIKESDEGKKYLKTFSLTNIAWNEETRRLFEEKSQDGLEFHNLDTLFGEVIRTGNVLMTNSPDKHPASSGRPKGHPPLDSFMGVPLHSGDRFIGMVGLANRDNGYDEKFYASLTEIFETISSIVNIFLLERDLKEVGKLNSLYKDAVDQAAIISIANRDRKIVYVNELFENTFGFTSLEIINQGHQIINSGKMPSGFFSSMWDKLSSGSQWRGEVCNKAKNGDLLWMDVTVIPFRNHGEEVDQYIFIRKDITKEREQKKLEIAFQKAEESAKAKSEFLSMMSHEIRTPLNGVIGMADLLKETSLAGDQRELVDTIVNSGKTLLSIINDILDLSKIEAGKLSLEEAECDVKSFIEKLVKPFNISCEEKGLGFNFESDDYEHHVFLDSARLGQVITNLCSNAIKFTQKGDIKIKLSRNSVVGGKVTGVNLLVEDTGVGLSDEEMDLIFEPFSQLGENHQKIGGTGLGLSITRKIVDMMGGVVEVNSTKGVGSCFKVQLFLKTGKKINPLKNRETFDLISDRFVSKKSKILIAEDNPTNQIVVKKMIESLGHKAICVSDGEQALHKLDSERFDLVLMDCQMPVMNGFESTKAIRQSNEWYKNIPIVALTANAIKGDDQKCFDSGMTGYLSKPIIKSTLENELKKFLKKEEDLIDTQKLNEFFESEIDGDVETFKEIINSFLSSAASQVDVIIESFTRDQFEKIYFEAHSLKSSSALVGALELSELCRQIELLLNQNGQSEIGDLVMEMKRVAEKSFESLKKHLPELTIPS